MGVRLLGKDTSRFFDVWAVFEGARDQLKNQLILENQLVLLVHFNYRKTTSKHILLTQLSCQC